MRKLDLVEDEKIISKSPASLERGSKRHDGELVLTNKRLHFSSIENIGWTCWLDELVNIKIISNGVNATTKGGLNENILVFKREAWCQQIIAAQVLYVKESALEKTAPAELTGVLVNRAQLRLKLEKKFSDSELKAMCFDLEIEYENVAGNTREARTRELLLLVERNGRMAEFIACCKAERPAVDWDS